MNAKRFFFLLYQFSKPVLALLFVAGVLYLDHGLNAAGCRYVVERGAGI